MGRIVQRKKPKTPFDPTRQRVASRPPISRTVYNLILQFLRERKLREDDPSIQETPWRTWLVLFKEAPDFQRLKKKNKSVRSHFMSWVNYLQVKKVNHKDVLCAKPSGKIIVPKEDFARVIREAHCGNGEFTPKVEDVRIGKNKKMRKRHNNLQKTFNLVCLFNSHDI